MMPMYANCTERLAMDDIPEAVWRVEDDGTLVIAPPDGCRQALLSSALGSPWDAQAGDILHLRVEPGVVGDGYLGELFADLENLVDADVAALDFSHVVDMDGMFLGCKSLTALDLSRWDVSAVQNMNGLFGECESLVTLNVDGWDVSNVDNFSSMFYGCVALEEPSCLRDWGIPDPARGDPLDMFGLNGPEWGRSSAEPFSWRIDDEGTLVLEGENADLPKSPTPWSDRKDEIRHIRVRGRLNAPEDLSCYFAGLKNLESVDLGWLSTEETDDVSGLFAFCPKLRSLKLWGFVRSDVTHADNMFAGCTSLAELDLRDWNVMGITQATYDYAFIDEHTGSALRMFAGCESLERVDMSNWFVSDIDDAWEGVFDGCPTVPELVLDGWYGLNQRYMRERLERAGRTDTVECRLEDDGTLVVAPPRGCKTGVLRIAKQDTLFEGRIYRGPWEGLSRLFAALRVEPGVVLEGPREHLEDLISYDRRIDISALEIPED